MGRTIGAALLRAGSLALGLFLCVSLACRSAAPTRAAREPEPGEPFVRILSWNVNYGLAGDPQAIAAIRASEADLVFLQETTPEWEAALRGELADAYPCMAFREGPGAGGQAVLSRWPFAEADFLPPVHGWFPAWRLRLETPLGAVQALQVHLRPPLDEDGGFLSAYVSTPPVREAELRDFAATLEPHLPTLVVGDFNEGPRGRAVSLLRERGFRSALGELAPGTPTWRWTTSIGTLRATLDHVLHSDELEPLSARVVNAGRSDHLPIVAVFTRKDLR